MAQGKAMRYPEIVNPSGQEVQVPEQALKAPVFSKIIVPTDSPAATKVMLGLKGCSVAHELNDAIAVRCPSDTKIEGAFEDEVLYIMDLQAVQQINADHVWTLGYTGSGVNVAVLDTGVDKDNPELQREAELIIGKHRSGNTGEIKLAWHGQFTTFKDFSYGGEPGGGPPNRGSPPDIF